MATILSKLGPHRRLRVCLPLDQATEDRRILWGWICLQMVLPVGYGVDARLGLVCHEGLVRDVDHHDSMGQDSSTDQPFCLLLRFRKTLQYKAFHSDF